MGAVRHSPCCQPQSSAMQRLACACNSGVWRFVSVHSSSPLFCIKTADKAAHAVPLQSSPQKRHHDANSAAPVIVHPTQHSIVRLIGLGRLQRILEALHLRYIIGHGRIGPLSEHVSTARPKDTGSLRATACAPWHMGNYILGGNSQGELPPSPKRISPCTQSAHFLPTCISSRSICLSISDRMAFMRASDDSDVESVLAIASSAALCSMIGT